MSRSRRNTTSLLTRIATITLVVLLVVAFAAWRVLPRHTGAAPTPTPTAAPAASPAIPDAGLTASGSVGQTSSPLTQQSAEQSAEAALPTKAVPGLLVGTFALESGTVVGAHALTVTIADARGRVVARSTAPVVGPGPFAFRVHFNPAQVKAGRGYVVHAKVSKWSADFPLDDEMPAGLELMGTPQ